jgi:hypothetical protein
MLTSDQTLVDSRSSQTFLGSLGSKVYAEVLSGSLTKSKRQILATALTTPQIIFVEQRNSGAGLAARRAFSVRHEYSDLTVDPALYGGVAPSSAITLTVNWASVGAAITATKIKDQFGALCDMLHIATQFDNLLGGGA